MKRTALVTGGNRGIGREVCRQLAHRGLRVVLARRCQSDGEQAARELWSDCAADVVVVPLDVSDPASIAACTEELTGRDVQVDVLVNNAAICPEGRVLDLDHDTAEKALRTNLGGPFWLIRAFVPDMVRRGYGRVVNVSSEWGSFGGGLGGPCGYSLTKTALRTVVKIKLAPSIGDLVHCSRAAQHRTGSHHRREVCCGHAGPG